jgi:hypothetical protein
MILTDVSGPIASVKPVKNSDDAKHRSKKDENPDAAKEKHDKGSAHGSGLDLMAYRKRKAGV